ncbi:GFA family protein [Sphingopyxis sp. 113P3]|uniref:GFA family protein n=1 Tax=Sphingopyxis sp. (strain 113P3) TaxID=292913 RepID=UPI0006BDAF93|nr:GFA family protein [Sphingopyxis sp. 113P3]ALC12707.1 hypothetical protein LH20_12165 [Sphingopyxis sp. 113P3]
MERHATCHCGQLNLRCVGEPSKVSMCHCRDCQRRTGSLFSVAAFFPRDDVERTQGTFMSFTRPSASGFDVTFCFCPDCGSSLWWEAARMPHLLGIAAGAFADPGFPRPEQAVWCEDKHDWLELPAQLETHARNPLKVPPDD